MIDRRKFIKTGAMSGIGIVTAPSLIGSFNLQAGKRVGIIGLDTSQSIAYTKGLNSADAGRKYSNFRVVAAYPKSSLDIKSSVARIAE